LLVYKTRKTIKDKSIERDISINKFKHKRKEIKINLKSKISKLFQNSNIGKLKLKQRFLSN